MTKKGFIQDFAFFGIIIFVLAIMLVVGGKIMGDINTNYQATNASSTAKNMMSGLEARYDGVFDWVFVTVFVIFILAIFVSFFVLDTHPALFFIVLLVFAVILIPMAIVGNVFEEFTDGTVMETQADEMTLLTYIMDNWVFMLGVFGLIGLVVLFAKLKGGGF